MGDILNMHGIPGIIKEKNFLNILLNDAMVTMTPKQLFDPAFDRISLATYVSSPSYLTRLKGFRNVRLIVGEEETGRRMVGMNHIVEDQYLRELDSGILKMVSDGAFEVRTSPLGETVHSKIYILENTSTGAMRVMAGSMNFTKTATSGKQYEELVAYDSSVNRAFCEAFLKRFEDIWSDSVSFFTEITKKKIKLSIITADTVQAGTIENSVIFSENVEAGSTENCTIITFSPEEEAQRIIEKVFENMPYQENIEDYRSQVEEALAMQVEIRRETETCNEMLDIVTKKQGGKDVFRKKSEMRKVMAILKEKVVASNRKSRETEIPRPRLLYQPGGTVPYYSTSADDTSGVLYAEELPKERLKKSLESLASFIATYSKFTSRKDDGETEQKAFEAVLYSFISPCVWLIRKNVAVEHSREKLAEVPVFMVIGGQANTGKTRLIRNLSKMTGGAGNYSDYKTIESHKHRVISDVLQSGNVYPLIVDEVSPKFFANTGEAVIKSISNTVRDQRPVFIGATNQEFTAESQVIRRVYYLHFDNPIDREKAKEAEKYFEDNVGDIDDGLFRHFLFLFHERINSGEEFYRIDDPLWYGREIFRRLFDEHTGSVPRFINDRPLGDYYREGELLWHALYRQSKDAFFVTRKDGEVYFSIDMAKRYHMLRDIDKLVKRLPPGIVRASGPVLVLYREKFLSFIGEDGNAIKRFFRSFQKNGG